jgi:hypothetical protein
MAIYHIGVAKGLQIRGNPLHGISSCRKAGAHVAFAGRAALIGACVELGFSSSSQWSGCMIRKSGYSVFPRDKREAFARRSCSSKNIERYDGSKNLITL